MKLAEVAELYAAISKELREKYPVLQNWSYRWNDRLTNAMGRCCIKRGEKYIELSTQIIALNLNIENFKEVIKTVIIHEWCHALDYEETKTMSHGPSWKRWMIRLGLRPERCFSGECVLTPQRGANYAIRNTTTGKIFRYYKNVPMLSEITGAVHWNYVVHKRPVSEDLVFVNLKTAVAKKVA